MCAHSAFALRDLMILFQPVAYYWGDQPGYNEVRDVHWPGGRTTPPPNQPKCWFKNDNPDCIPPGNERCALLDKIEKGRAKTKARPKPKPKQTRLQTQSKLTPKPKINLSCGTHNLYFVWIHS